MTTPTILSEEFPELLLSGWNLFMLIYYSLILYLNANVNKKIISIVQIYNYLSDKLK